MHFTGSISPSFLTSLFEVPWEVEFTPKIAISDPLRVFVMIGLGIQVKASLEEAYSIRHVLKTFLKTDGVSFSLKSVS